MVFSLLSERDIKDTIFRYSERHDKYGYSPKSLGWDKGKQDIRFDVLTSNIDCKGKLFLDIGCGFGDLNKTLFVKSGGVYKYVGVDIVPDLLQEARARYGNESIKFIEGDFLAENMDVKPDFAIASGVFNFKLKDVDNYSFIEAMMRKAFDLCGEGFAFDFLSDKVDFRLTHTFHSSPERIISMAYRLSRNVVLRNDYMPFEFSVFVFKDDSFLSEDTVFQRYKLMCQ